jgi:HK97 family phage major capsid protein
LNPATNEGAATGVAEGSAKPEATMEFESDTAVVRKIAAWIPATMEILADAPTLQGYINARLVYMLKFREQQQILAGDGTGGDLKGLDSFTTQTAGTTNNDAFVDIAEAIGKVENVDGQANGAVLNPTDFWDIVATRRSTWFDGNISNAGTAPFGGPAGTIWGLPVVRTRSVPTLTAWVADFSGAMIFDRMQTTVRQSDSHDDYFVKNKVAILAEERLAFAVFRPDFFVQTTIDITA